MNAPGGKKHPILNCTRRKNLREEKRETRRSLQHPERKASGDLSTYFSGGGGGGGWRFDSDRN